MKTFSPVLGIIASSAMLNTLPVLSADQTPLTDKTISPACIPFADLVTATNCGEPPEATVPAIPANLSAVLSASNISTSWSAVSGASSYRIRQRVNGSWQPEMNTGSLRQRAFSVAAGSRYQYQVRACTVANTCSFWSTATAEILVGPTAPPPVVTVPVAPAGLRATLGSNTISTSWEAVLGASSYRIRQSVNGVWQVEINKGTVRQHQFGAISAANHYGYQVRACNASGQCSDWSPKLNINTSATIIYVHTDLLGSVIAESNAAGQLIKKTEY
ncbi:hypothetical protein, partial [Arsukibacterium sp.]|uniref:hypothetical protein n=1 Tax=Arsukibacterium sp. TaxID=1977258 RepID=UPI002FD913F9